jgi:hypothetical protein
MANQIYFSQMDARVLAHALKLTLQTERVKDMRARLERFLEERPLPDVLCACGCGREVSRGKKGRIRRFYSGACRARDFRRRRGHPPKRGKEQWT